MHLEIIKELPEDKRAYMELLFRNCTEEVRYYMSLVEIPANQTFIKAGTECTHIFMILSGKVTGVEWPAHDRSYPFKDFGPGDFFGEIECFAGLPCYRISILAATRCRVLTIPAVCYMEWMRMDVDALFMAHPGEHAPADHPETRDLVLSLHGGKGPADGPPDPSV